MRIICFLLTLIITLTASAAQDIISIFPLKNYNQSIDAWIKPTDSDYDTPLLTKEMQQQRLTIFYRHYFGLSSPWNRDYVTRIVQQDKGEDIVSVEKSLLYDFNNKGKREKEIGYGENFRIYDEAWIDAIRDNINLDQLQKIKYETTNRAITIDNLYVRALPTDDPYFYSYKIAGQGYPFDNLQISAIWVGTPVYILAETRDRAWSLVLTPDYIGWVKSKGIARVSYHFVDRWTMAAKNQLIAITRTKTSLLDNDEKFVLQTYVGTVLPGQQTKSGWQLWVPVADIKGRATIKYAHANADSIAPMPLVATPHHVATIMATLINRPYGWGGMYFYNDCSAELKNLFTPFAIWLPRHSSEQITAGKTVDISSASAKKRLEYLMSHGQKLLTIVYIGHHVFLYVGNDTHVAMTYQNKWGLSPDSGARRAVIGKSVLFPLLLLYPEDTRLISQASGKYFQLSYLNQIPERIMNKQQLPLNLRELMYPEVIMMK